MHSQPEMQSQLEYEDNMNGKTYLMIRITHRLGRCISNFCIVLINNCWISTTETLAAWIIIICCITTVDVEVACIVIFGT
jgi:hypothetical protein